MSTVYWAPFLTPGKTIKSGATISLFNYYEPLRLVDDLDRNKFYDTNLIKCGSFIQHVKNTYIIKSPLEYDYVIDTSQKRFYSNYYDDNFLKTFTKLFDGDQKLISFNISYIFFSEEDITMQLRPCTYHTNNFIDSTQIVGGDLNISKWFRPTDCAFFMKTDKINLQSGDPMFYLTFQTPDDSTIRLKRFHVTSEIEEISKAVVDTKIFKGKNVWPLQKYYNVFKQSGYNKRLIKLIKENLIN